jgi:hypothetical protein
MAGVSRIATAGTTFNRDAQDIQDCNGQNGIRQDGRDMTGR